MPATNRPGATNLEAIISQVIGDGETPASCMLVKMRDVPGGISPRAMASFHACKTQQITELEDFAKRVKTRGESGQRTMYH